METWSLEQKNLSKQVLTLRFLALIDKDHNQVKESKRVPMRYSFYLQVVPVDDIWELYVLTKNEFLSLLQQSGSRASRNRF